MSVPRLVLSEGTPADQALRQLDETGLPGAPVVDKDGRWRGLVLAARLSQQVSGSGAAKTLGKLADQTAGTVPVDATLEAAITALATGNRSWVPVVDNDGRVTGIVGMTDVMKGYRSALLSSLRKIGLAGRGAVLVEETVGEHAPGEGVAIRELQLPPGTVFMTIERAGQLLFAGPDTTIRAGDQIALVTRPEQIQTVRATLGSVAADVPPDGSTDGWSAGGLV